jgi:hypothetical protein
VLLLPLLLSDDTTLRKGRRDNTKLVCGRALQWLCVHCCHQAHAALTDARLAVGCVQPVQGTL